MNRVQVREQRRQSKLRLTKKVRVVRGKILYGQYDVTDIMDLGLFTHASTAVKAILQGMDAKTILELQKQQQEKNTISVDTETEGLSIESQLELQPEVEAKNEEEGQKE